MNASGDLSVRLRALREKRGLSLHELARGVGVSVTSVFQWERDTNPRQEHIDALARTLMVSPEYLVTGVDDDAWGQKLDEAVRLAKELIADRTGLDPDQIKIKINLEPGQP